MLISNTCPHIVLCSNTCRHTLRFKSTLRFNRSSRHFQLFKSGPDLYWGKMQAHCSAYTLTLFVYLQSWERKCFFGKSSVKKNATWRNVCMLQHVRWRLLSSTVETTTNYVCINLAVRVTKVEWYRTNQNTKHSNCGKFCCNIHSHMNVKMWFDANTI